MLTHFSLVDFHAGHIVTNADSNSPLCMYVYVKGERGVGVRGGHMMCMWCVNIGCQCQLSASTMPIAVVEAIATIANLLPSFARLLLGSFLLLSLYYLLASNKRGDTCRLPFLLSCEMEPLLIPNKQHLVGKPAELWHGVARSTLYTQKILAPI